MGWPWTGLAPWHCTQGQGVGRTEGHLPEVCGLESFSFLLVAFILVCVCVCGVWVVSLVSAYTQAIELCVSHTAGVDSTHRTGDCLS